MTVGEFQEVNSNRIRKVVLKKKTKKKKKNEKRLAFTFFFLFEISEKFLTFTNRNVSTELNQRFQNGQVCKNISKKKIQKN